MPDTKKSGTLRTLALILSVLTVFGACRIYAFSSGLPSEENPPAGEETAQNNASSVVGSDAYTSLEGDSPYLEEVPSLRDKFTKHYVDQSVNAIPKTEQ